MSGVFHGGGLDAAIARYGGKREDWLDLSTGINPVAYPVGEIEPAAWSRLPDQGAMDRLLVAACNYYRVSEGSGIVAGNGTQALMELLPRVLDTKSVAIVSPTYGEHAYIWKRSCGTVSMISKPEEAGDAETLVIVNPNNPDARLWQPENLIALCEKHVHVIVDEAFCDAHPTHSLIPHLPENAIVLRSFGKFFGLAGLRLGFAIAASEIVDQFTKLQGPWAVSGPALAIGAKALAGEDWIEQTRIGLEAGSHALADTLTDSGLAVVGHNPLFVYASHANALALHDHLAKKHILVRPFADMPDKLRFGLPADIMELARLREALVAYE